MFSISTEIRFCNEFSGGGTFLKVKVRWSNLSKTDFYEEDVLSISYIEK